MQTTTTSYETLRSWYLAKLRKSAIEAQVSGQLTPSALIAADREVIEKLIAERAEAEDSAATKKQAASNSLLPALAFWGYLLAATLVSLFLFCLADFSIFADVLLVSLNPANIMANSRSLPNPLVLLAVQSAVYVYPLIAIPLSLLSKRDSA